MRLPSESLRKPCTACPPLAEIVPKGERKDLWYAFLTLYNKLVYYIFMPHVSRNKLSKEVETALIEKVSYALTNINKSDEMSGFLDSLLTSKRN